MNRARGSIVVCIMHGLGMSHYLSNIQYSEIRIAPPGTVPIPHYFQTSRIGPGEEYTSTYVSHAKHSLKYTVQFCPAGFMNTFLQHFSSSIKSV